MTTILTGSYERFLFGFEVGGSEDKVRVEWKREKRRRPAHAGGRRRSTFLAATKLAQPSPSLHSFHQPSTLTRSFYVPVHKGPVKCVAAATPFAATGGTDDCIHLFDVRVSLKNGDREQTKKPPPPPCLDSKFTLAPSTLYPPCPRLTHTLHSSPFSLSFHTKAHADLGFLMSPGAGAVSALSFYTPPDAAAPSHLLSGTADGGIAVWNAGGEWDCLKTMEDHTCVVGDGGVLGRE